MIWNHIQNKLFANKLVVDERKPILSFALPRTDLKCHVLPPYLSFYTQLVLVCVIYLRVCSYFESFDSSTTSYSFSNFDFDMTKAVRFANYHSIMYGNVHLQVYCEQFKQCKKY